MDVEEKDGKIMYQLTEEGKIFLNGISRSILNFFCIMTKNFAFVKGE